MHWKVIVQEGGHIAVLGSHDATHRPTANETLLWEGDARDNADALYQAHEKRPDIDLVGLRLRKPR